MKEEKKSFEDEERFEEFCERNSERITNFFKRLLRKSKKDKKVIIPKETRKKTTVPKESNSRFQKFKKFLNQVSDSITAKTVKFSIVVTLVVLVLGGISLWGVFVITGNILWIITGTIFLLGANWMIEKGFKGIPAVNPPCVGLVTIWEKKTNLVLDEGLRLLAPFFPFFFNVILIDMEKKNEDYLFEGVRCHSEKGEGESGGSVAVEIGLTWIPDIKNLINHVNSGGKEGVRDIMRDILAEDVRQMGKEKTWEEMTFATYDLALRLILKLVGKEGDENLKKYNELSEEDKKDPKKILPILEEIISGGVSDERKLGIKILRLNVKPIIPEGKLKDDAEKIAREEMQRKSENFEADTTIEIAKKYKDQLGISPSDAFHGVQVQQGKAKGIVISGGGKNDETEAGDVTKGAAILTLKEGGNN